MKTAQHKFDEQIEALIEQRRVHCPANCGWADYEIRAIRGEGGFSEHAVFALGFNYQYFNMQDAQAVSCDVCGVLLADSLRFMRRHRLDCGWT